MTVTNILDNVNCLMCNIYWLPVSHNNALVNICEKIHIHMCVCVYIHIYVTSLFLKKNRLTATVSHTESCAANHSTNAALRHTKR